MKITPTLLVALAAFCAGCLDAPESDESLGTVETYQLPKSSFHHVEEVNVPHVVYVVDRSRSMQQTFDFVRDELLRDLSDMRPTTKFHVIFFSNEQDVNNVVENKPRRLVKAADQNKKDVAEFIKNVKNVKLGGHVTNPIPALRRAFAVLSSADTRRKYVFLLTDGEFADSRAVIEGLRKLNADRSVTVHTILHKYRDAEPEDILRIIAKEHSGRFKLAEELDY